MSNRLYIIVLLILFVLNIGLSQDITFRNQIEIDTFDTSITNLPGRLFITSDITDLTNLSNITSIGGDLWIRYTDSLQNLDGLNNLSTIGGGWRIESNESLQNINGLEGVTSVNGSILFLGNDLLQNLDGLENINTDQSVISISDNKVLENIDGLQSVTSVDFFIAVVDNPMLQNINGLENITSVGDNVRIVESLTLQNLNGLKSISSVGGMLEITSNPELIDLVGLEKLTTVSEHVIIENNNNLQTSEGIGNLEYVGGNFEISGNDKLIDLNGFNNLITVEGDLTIAENLELENIDGLSNVSTLRGKLSISENHLIQSLPEFVNLTSVESLIIDENSALQNLDGLESLTSIIEDLTIEFNSSLEDISALKNIFFVGFDLRIVNNGVLQSLNGLDLITNVEGDYNISGNISLPNLNPLGNLTSVVGDFRIASCTALNDLKGLEGVTFVGGDLTISSNNGLLNLNGLENLSTIGIDLIISSNSSLENLDGLESLNTVGAEFSLTLNSALQDLNGLGRLVSVGGDFSINRNDALLIVDGLPNLSRVGGYFWIWDNEGLLKLDGINKLTSVDDNFSITNNPNLEICCGAKPLLLNSDSIGGVIIINNNATGCNSQEEILSYACDDVFTIKGCLYWDENSNGIKDIEERSINNLGTVISPNDIVNYSDFDGCYSRILENGNYSITNTSSRIWQLSSDSLAYHIEVTDNSLTSLDFGFIPRDTFMAGLMHGVSGIARCNTDVKFDFTFQNQGTTIITEGILWVYQDSLTELASTQLPIDTMLDERIFGWKFTNLYPGESITRTIRLAVPGLGGDIEPGTLIEIFSATEAKNTQGFTNFFKHNYEEEIRCAYDPNDKLISPLRAEEENYTLFGDTLVYTIRFQNTGNDTAFNVVIRDTLDLSLDVSTFNVIHSSHRSALMVDIIDERAVAFNFENIMLPDSTIDFEGSQGYVTFSIQANDIIEEFTEVENTASIYFDFNPPIVTNTTLSTMVSCYPVEAQFVSATLSVGDIYNLPDGTAVSEAGTYNVTIEDEEGCPLEIYIVALDFTSSISRLELQNVMSIAPNPSQDNFILSLDIDREIDLVGIISDPFGNKISLSEIQGSTVMFDTDQLAVGVYFLQLQSRDGELLGVKKFMVID